MVKKASTIWLPLDKQAEIKEDGADKKRKTSNEVKSRREQNSVVLTGTMFSRRPARHSLIFILLAQHWSEAGFTAQHSTNKKINK